MMGLASLNTVRSVPARSHMDELFNSLRHDRMRGRYVSVYADDNGKGTREDMDESRMNGCARNDTTGVDG